MVKEEFINKIDTLAVVGLGYVGLPLAIAFSKKLKTIGFDINIDKINILKEGIDPTQEVGNENLKKCNIFFTNDENELQNSKYIIVSVPTPVKKDHTPDLSAMIEACEIIGRNITKGTTVIFESTVYPGVTEDICAIEIEKNSKFVCGSDFYIGYSPERINPGDKIHKLKNITKLVSGMDKKTLSLIRELYSLIIDNVYPVESIKIAEAAKIIENTQRDINIAFINETAIMLDNMKISSNAVIKAMNTKWNALGFQPGLVGGHCISVDPYYLVYKSEINNIGNEMVTLARKINNKMVDFITENIIKKLIQEKHAIKNDKIYFFGLTFKENCPDVRNSKVIEIIRKLREYAVNVKVVDPYVNKVEAKKIFNIDIVDCNEISDADCLIFTVAHNEFKNYNNEDLKKMSRNSFMGNKTVIIDVKNMYNGKYLNDLGFAYWSL